MPRGSLCHGVRGRARRGHPARRRGRTLLGEARPSRPHHQRQQARQLLGDGRHGPMRAMLGNPPRLTQRGREGQGAGTRARDQGQPAGDRDMEPRVHAVQPQGRRHARETRNERDRHGHGLRAAREGHTGQTLQLRHRRVPAIDTRDRETQRNEIRGRRPVR